MFDTDGYAAPHCYERCRYLHNKLSSTDYTTSLLSPVHLRSWVSHDEATRLLATDEGTARAQLSEHPTLFGLDRSRATRSGHPVEKLLVSQWQNNTHEHLARARVRREHAYR